MARYKARSAMNGLIWDALKCITYWIHYTILRIIDQEHRVSVDSMSNCLMNESI